MKKSLLLGILIISIICICSCGKTRNSTGEQVETLHIELISSDGKSVEKTIVDKRDSSKIEDIILGEEIIPDDGFVFAPGGYRIVINTGKEVVYYYPYCDDVSTIRVGDEGYDFIWLDDEDAEKLEEILDKYNEGREGIWDWSEVKG